MGISFKAHSRVGGVEADVLLTKNNAAILFAGAVSFQTSALSPLQNVFRPFPSAAAFASQTPFGSHRRKLGGRALRSSQVLPKLKLPNGVCTSPAADS